ncbi:MAG: chromate resistance protein ChrB [Rhodospirillales bacterium]|nr:chromate resistance protein ChrB [Rhodospirillales bacterium]
MLSYKVPSEPARHRMAVWRRLKSLGAIYLNNGVCLVPSNPDHLRQVRILSNEIGEMGGEAVVLEAAPIDPAQRERVADRFRSDRDEAYQEFIERCDGFEAEIARESAAGKFTYAELEENDEDLKKLRTWFEKIRKLDFYGASLGAEANDRLGRCAVLLDKFAQQVFDAQAENAAVNEEAQQPTPRGEEK